MATETVVEAVDVLGDGAYLVGQFLGARDGREWTGKTDGKVRRPLDVSLLVGTSVKRIQYPSREDAATALGAAWGDQSHPRVALRVFPRPFPREADVFYDGPRARGADEGEPPF